MSFTDDFNRASLGANWATVQGTDWVTASSLYLKPGGQYQNTAVRVVGTFPNDQLAEVWTEVVSGAGDPTGFHGPAVRMDNGGNCYFGIISETEVNIYKRVAGTNTDLADFPLVSPTDTLIKLTLVVTGTSLELFVSDVSQGTVSDASLTTGNPGCRALTGETAKFPRFDDFACTSQVSGLVGQGLLLGVGR